MVDNRDNFTRKTVDILGKRVGYFCSNPNCRKHTVGPNEHPEKATVIGIAAHITAASPEGPRYNNTLNEIERIHINNGIWLCSNCATLIDKDPLKYSVQLLSKWKKDAETEISQKLEGIFKDVKTKTTPFLEADLIWTSSSRWNRGYSEKNPRIIDEDGSEVILIDLSTRTPIIYWELIWNLTFTIHNNSSVPAYNVSIEDIGNVHFTSMSKLSKTNNLPPYQGLDLNARYYQNLEDTHIVADKILTSKIPQNLEGLTLRVTYYDDSRIQYSTIVQIKDGKLINTKE